MFVLVLMILASRIDYIEPSRSNDLRNAIEKYYESDTVRTMRKLWDEHRQPIEHALAKALLETIGKDGSNVFTLKPSNLKLCNSFYAKSQRRRKTSVELLLMNLYLSQLPNCLLPDVMFSLSSNILKFQCTLTKLIVNAEYLVIRNDSKLVDDEKELNGGTQFLLREIPSRGKITLLMDNCILNGYTIARIKDAAVKLGYLRIRSPNCRDFDTEIHGDGLRGRPLKTFRNIGKNFDVSTIRAHILVLLRLEFVTKLQGMMFSYINTTAIFGHSLRKYEQEQEAIFLQTSSAMAKFFRYINQATLLKNGGAFDLPEYHNSLQMEAANNEPRLLLPRYRNISLTELVLYGLDTSYISYTGGPFKINMIGVIEKQLFRKLWIRGALYLNEGDNSLQRHISAEISDYFVEFRTPVKHNSSTKRMISYSMKIELAPQVFISMDMKNLIEAYLIYAVEKTLSENNIFEAILQKSGVFIFSTEKEALV